MKRSLKSAGQNYNTLHTQRQGRFFLVVFVYRVDPLFFSAFLALLRCRRMKIRGKSGQRQEAELAEGAILPGKTPFL